MSALLQKLILGSADCLAGHRAIFRHDVDANGVSPQFLRGFQRRARAGERVQHPVACVGEKLDEPLRQGPGESGAVVFVAALGRQMQHVGWIGHRALDPVGDILAKTAADLRVEAHDVIFAQ